MPILFAKNCMCRIDCNTELCSMRMWKWSNFAKSYIISHLDHLQSAQQSIWFLPHTKNLFSFVFSRPLQWRIFQKKKTVICISYCETHQYLQGPFSSLSIIHVEIICILFRGMDFRKTEEKANLMCNLCIFVVKSNLDVATNDAPLWYPLIILSSNTPLLPYSVRKPSKFISFCCTTHSVPG